MHQKPVFISYFPNKKIKNVNFYKYATLATSVLLILTNEYQPCELIHTGLKPKSVDGAVLSVMLTGFSSLRI